MNWIKITLVQPPEGQEVWVYPVQEAPLGSNFTMKLVKDAHNWRVAVGRGVIGEIKDFQYWHHADVNYNQPPTVSNPKHCPECQTRDMK